jgi:Ser/Thr protein kinase RdoA (MazF antagonist)
VLVEDQKRQTEEAPRRPEHTEKQGQESGEEEAVATPPETTSQAIQLPQQTGLVMDDARGWKFEEVEGGEECCEDAFSKLVAGDYSPEEGVELAESFLTNNALPYDASLNIENLEEGSRNNVFRVWDNGEVDFVFRIPKPTVDPTDQERGAGLVRESGVLNRLPPTIAAPYFKLDDSCALLPFPYVVESYIPGHDGSEAVWNESSLTALGKKLGYAHKSGSSSQATVLGENVQRMDLCYEFNTRVNGGLSRLRDESAIAVAESLVRAISKYLKKGQQLFDSIDTFSLLHNDLAPSNIQVTDGDVFIRDWEFTAFGDGAHDLSLFYDASARLVDGKMRVFLNEYQEDTLLDAYQSVFGHDPTLKQRVRIWQQLEKAATVLYMMEELDNPGTTRLQRFPRELLRRECDLVLSTIDFRIPMVY